MSDDELPDPEDVIASHSPGEEDNEEFLDRAERIIEEDREILDSLAE